MTAIARVAVLVLGAGLAVGGILRAFDAAGLDPDLRVVYGWSVLVVLGLYLVGWGLTWWLFAGETDRVSRPSPSRDATIGTRTSAHARTGRGRGRRRRE